MKQSVSFAPQHSNHFQSQKTPYKKATLSFKVGCNAYLNVIDAAAEHRETGESIRAYERDEQGNRVEVTQHAHIQELIKDSIFLAPKPTFVELSDNP